MKRFYCKWKIRKFPSYSFT